MFTRLLILFTIVPVLELYILIKVGEYIGAFNTVLIIIGTAFLGAWLAKSQGFAVFRDMKTAINNGRVPAVELMHGVLVLAGAIMLLAPGIITDVIGITLLFPPTRKIYLAWILRIIKKRIRTGRWNFRLFN